MSLSNMITTETGISLKVLLIFFGALAGIAAWGLSIDRQLTEHSTTLVHIQTRQNELRTDIKELDRKIDLLIERKIS